MRFGHLFCLAAAAALGTARANAQPARDDSQKNLGDVAAESRPKFFSDPIFAGHYDSRFASAPLDYEDQKMALKSLVQTYLATFSDLGVETWLTHGALLGWWWNKQILPWASSIDMQVSEASMYYLAAYYNMSLFHFRTTRIRKGRDYLLEINPHYTDREHIDGRDVVDARWIDTDTGLYIDITTVRYDLNHPDGEGMLSCKDGHEYPDTSIFPLRETTFEGSPAKIPYKHRDLLETEFTPKALKNRDFHGHVFDEKEMEWTPKETIQTV